MLSHHFRAPEYAISPRQLAEFGNYRGNSIPAMYGALGSEICRQLAHKMTPNWQILAFRRPDGKLVLHQQVVRAICELGWFTDKLPLEQIYVPYTPPTSTPLSEDDANDYAIENRRAEVEVRQKHSKFRREVVENFGKKCCLSGIQEESLLVASHIVPWNECVESRLDPANGLCLSVLYDRLFDRGYITFDDNLHVIITPLASKLSDATREILRSIDGLQACAPRRKIKTKYLSYHRKKKFKRD
jgi:hypothetical protein